MGPCCAFIFRRRWFTADVDTHRYAKAVEAFTKALELANEEADRPSKSGVWEATHLNLGLAYYHLGSTALSKTHLEKVLSLNPKSATALGALGMVAHAQGEVVEAVGWYHRSLAIETDEVIAEMLNFALEELPDADSGTIAAGAEVGEGAWVPDKLRVLVTEGPLSERASPLHPAHVPAQHIPIGSLSGVIPTRKGKEALGGAVDAVTPVPDPGRLAPPAHNHRARRRIDSFESVEDDEAEDLGAYDANNEEVYGDDEDDEGGFEEDMEME